ncbi:MAG: dihydrofolate reductase family protein [Betaproteobacteria bacterium]|nr:dihydrofolate reductase family protein [Betaproteobacteria bacterium]
MRKLASYLFVSLDGVVDTPNQYVRGESYADIPDDSVLQQDAVLLGRKTYEEWANFWPGSTIEPFATFINNTPKFVVSSTLREVGWQYSTLIARDFLGEVTKLKSQPGKTIGVHGSVSLTQSLLLAGLLDELCLVQCPAIAGSGRHLLDHGGPPVQLDLMSSRTTPSGLHLLVYSPRR